MREDDQVAGILRRDETGRHSLETTPGQQEQTRINRQRDAAAPYHPAQRARVAMRRALEALIKQTEEPAEHPVHAGSEPVLFSVMAFEQDCAERGREGQRIEGADHGRDRDGERKLFIELPGDAADERGRNEHRAQHEGDGDDRAADFIHRFLCGFNRREAKRNVTLDVFHDDDGVVHDNADGEHDAEQGKVVQREAKQLHHGERADERHRHSEHRNDRRAPGLQENEDYQHDQQDGFEQRVHDRLDGFARKQGRVVNHAIVNAGREVPL